MSYEVRVILKLLRAAMLSPRFSRSLLTSIIAVIEEGEHLTNENGVTARLLKPREVV